MRSSFLLLLVLLSILAVACGLTVAPEPADPLPTWGWRHTRDGWESAHNWTPPPPAFNPTLHPVTVASMQLLVVLTALLGPQAATAQADTEPAAQAPVGRRKGAPSALKKT